MEHASDYADWIDVFWHKLGDDERRRTCSYNESCHDSLPLYSLICDLQCTLKKI